MKTTMLNRLFLRASQQALILCLLIFGCIPASGARPDLSAAQAQGAGATPHPSPVVKLVRDAAHPLTGGARDYDPLIDLIGEARFVLLGEATHGTHEFYRERARITRRLIEEKGFNAVVLEADWPDAHRVNDYIRGAGNDRNAQKALSGFKRFPRWMWRNTDMRDFVQWLRTHNDARTSRRVPVGLYGMDVYSLSASIDAVVKYLKKIDPDAAQRANKRYNCFLRFRNEPQLYGLEVTSGTARSCEKEAQQQFDEMQRRFAERSPADAGQADDELLSAYQNARVVKNSEAYYRTIYRRDISSWNLRDKHMADTLNDLAKHIDARGDGQARVVVWAHNTHQGDARMTERPAGEWNVGQLMRQQHLHNSVLVGFTTYTGKVRAASEWGGLDESMKVRPALAGSFSALFHETGIPAFLLLLRNGGKVADELGHYRLERAIGVTYLPRTERASHYFFARLSKQFDAVIHFDVTSAVEPL